ncbi:MAG: carbon-nitrogen family hydrolase [Chloroflexota bacterium]|nr:carbon-nitrogen family hydrolase [Chloroflexota bacterium]MDE2946045.1 carbon-nitrogen family hydrolase [Chloroflexota bacterium]
MTTLSISLGQMQIKLARVEDNLETAERMISQAATRDSQLILLPELWSTGYDLENAGDYADALGEGMFTQLAKSARDHSIAIYGSILERRGDQFMNCAAYVDAAGCLGAVYRKIHLFRLFDEHLWLGEGEAPTLLDMPGGPAGLSICYDLRFPELFRRYAVAHGARLILICAEWPLARVEHWRALLIARAIENQCYVAATNSCGDTGGAVFAGHSMIVDPWGKVIVEAGEDECLVMAEIDLDEVDRVRQTIPVFEDRRPDAYLTR